MKIKIGIGLKEGAYTPEAFAYAKFLTQRAFEVQIAPENQLESKNDINIRFMGISPFWSTKREKALTIHEYHSLSVPPIARPKDFLKKIINAKPAARIFLNQDVHNQLPFKDNLPYIYRDMGVDSSFFQTPSLNPIYDLVYCGSIAGRKGLIERFYSLAAIGIKIVIVGRIDLNLQRELAKTGKIFFTGPLKIEEIPSVFREARAGLNYTPNVYPFNIQTSTKTLEYIASGLHVISNRYAWIEAFAARRGEPIIWLDTLQSSDPLNARKAFIDISDCQWDVILMKSGLLSLLERVLH